MQKYTFFNIVQVVTINIYKQVEKNHNKHHISELQNNRPDSILHGVVTDAGSAEGDKVTSAVQSRAEVACKRADIGTLGASDAEVDIGKFDAGEFKFADGHLLGGDGSLAALAGEFIGTPASQLDSREDGGHLLYLSDKPLCHLPCPFGRDVFVWIFLINRMFQIKTRCSGSQAESTRVLLLLPLQGVDLLGHLAHADDKQARGEGVECARMAHLDFMARLFLHNASDLPHDIERGAFIGLVEEQDIAFGVHLEFRKCKGGLVNKFFFS